MILLRNIPRTSALGVGLLAAATACFGAQFTFDIPPVPVSVDIGGQAVAVILSGDVSGTPGPPGVNDQSFDLNLRADLGDFQIPSDRGFSRLS